MAGTPMDPSRRAQEPEIPLLTDEARSRFADWAQHRTLQAPVILDQRPLIAAGVWTDVEGLIRPTRWERLLSLRAEASLPLTLEFISSLRPCLEFDRREDVGISMRHDSGLVFTLLGQRHSITVAELGWRLGLYTQEETQHPSFADLPISVPDDFDIQAFWATHSRTDAPFEHQISHSSDWTEPSWRVLTFVMSMSYFGRPSNSNRVYSTDMLFFWSLANRRPVNLAVFVARFLWAQTYGTRLTLVCGPLVTLLHRSLQEHLLIPNLLPLEQSVRLLDTTMLTHTRLQRGQTRRVRPRAEIMPRPEATLHPNTIHEHRTESGQSSTATDSQIPLWAQSMMHQMNRIETQIQSIQLQFGEQMSGLHARFTEFESRFTEFENKYEADMTRLFD